MTRAKQGEVVRVPAPAFTPSFELFEAKLIRPQVRSETVPRKALVEHVRASRTNASVVSVAAPAGYGKTILLTQWAARDRRPFAWVSIDERDNDPSVLLTYVAAALDRIDPIDPSVLRALETPGTSIAATVVPRLARAFSAMGPMVLVLDDVHLLDAPTCLDAIDVLADHVPERSQIAIVGRGRLTRPLARARAAGLVLEIGADRLSMDTEEAGALVRSAGIELTEENVTELTRRTEGWPAALSLAARSLKAADGDRKVTRFSGGDRLVSDYLWLEFLSHLSGDEVRFLTRSAVLDRLTGSLCDAVLDTTGSAEILDELERSNLLLIPLDRTRDWYRYHHLFGEGLRAQLERDEPELVAQLRRRAADWYEGKGMLEDAMRYAQAAGDADRVARIVGRIALPMYAAGRARTLVGWFDWLERRGVIDRHPPSAVLGAWVQALMGRPGEAERWAEAAERAAYEGPLPDGSPSIEVWLRLLRAAMCREGVARMGEDATAAAATLAVGSQWRSTALLLVGVARWLAGDPDAADATLTDAADLAVHAGATGAASVALAERALLAMERGDWDEAEERVREALAVVRDAGIEEYMTSILVHAAAARVALRHGDASSAREDLARAQRLRPLLTRAFPHLAVQTRLELARAHLALSDPAGARMLSREISDLLRHQPDLGVLVQQAGELRSQLQSIRGGVAGVSTLTAAELRLLPLLPTHLSFREIGGELFVSQHTVKTQAISVYRKLGVTSRGAAIQRAGELGLLDP